MENESIKSAEMLLELIKAYSTYRATLEAANYTLYAAILTSSASVIAVIVNIWFNFRSKKIDYKRDYYRKIIDKRLNAYEKLQNYIGYIAVSMPIMNQDKRESIGDGVDIYCCFLKKEDLSVASEKTLKILNFAPWFSDDVANSLYSLNKILCDAQTVINHPSTENLGYYKLNEDILTNPNWHLNIAVIVYNEMYKHITVIKKGLLRDIRTIDNVEGFLNGKN